MRLRGVETAAPEEGYVPVTLNTSRGPVAGRYYAAAGSRCGVVWVGGIGGGWDTPAAGLYPRLARELASAGIASVRVRFRDPTDLDEAVLDVLAGLEYLRTQGIADAGLVGHSFGGAVVIQAAAASPVARTVVTLATQSYGTDPVRGLGPRCSILLMHGTDDEVLAPGNSERVYRLAREPKRLVLLQGASHVLDEAAEAVQRGAREWLLQQLGDACGRVSRPGGASGERPGE